MPSYDLEYDMDWVSRCRIAGMTISWQDAPIQGTSTDILKYALAPVYRHLPEGCSIVACVQDEIVLEVPEDQGETGERLLAKAMDMACQTHLKTGALPLPKARSASSWKKEWE
jgi:DNA polymerase I-like protein with 3'-5' exonuclease and polymerase domains